MQMNDIFNEQLVQRKPNKMDMIKKIGVIVLGLLLLIVVMGVPSLAGFQLPLIIVVIIGIVFVMRRFNIEYEYVFTNGDFDVDKIINKSKRKRVVSFHVSNIEVMVPAGNKDYARDVEKFGKLYDFSSGELKDNTYIAIAESGGTRMKIIFEPNEKMFDAIRSYIPRKIKK